MNDVKRYAWAQVPSLLVSPSENETVGQSDAG